jgi:hypothetical protein
LNETGGLGTTVSPSWRSPRRNRAGMTAFIEFMIFTLPVGGIDSIADGHWTVDFRRPIFANLREIQKVPRSHTPESR